MIESNKGFILFMTLCLIFIMNLLLLICMQQIVLYYQAINRQEQSHQSFYQLEGISAQLIGTLPFSQCMQAQDAANQVLQDLRKGQGCLGHLAEVNYRYFIEDLGVFPCLVLYQKDKKQASHHFRVSVALLDKEQQIDSLLQLRFIQTYKFESCSENEHIITTGISSWRYLPA